MHPGKAKTISFTADDAYHMNHNGKQRNMYQNELQYSGTGAASNVIHGRAKQKAVVSIITIDKYIKARSNQITSMDSNIGGQTIQISRAYSN
jgi:uncharacterized protein YebE (UPF0316 family)